MDIPLAPGTLGYTQLFSIIKQRELIIEMKSPKIIMNSKTSNFAIFISKPHNHRTNIIQAQIQTKRLRVSFDPNINFQEQLFHQPSSFVNSKYLFTSSYKYKLFIDTEAVFPIFEHNRCEQFFDRVYDHRHL